MLPRCIADGFVVEREHGVVVARVRTRQHGFVVWRREGGWRLRTVCRVTHKAAQLLPNGVAWEGTATVHVGYIETRLDDMGAQI
jgi:hypothetical protein